ncbi:MAG: 50S ribosomal protein L24 [Gammaproteobacteria bacterium]|nr:MAG: 50S ribosomal protein L24 [Gammaproteobacteria bacterium]
MAKIHKGDDVIVTTGKDKGKRGTVLQVLPLEDRVVVEGVAIAKRHTKPDPNRGVAGGIVEKEMPIHISNVQLFDPTAKKGSRVGYRTLENGKKVRYFKASNENIEV